MTAPNASAPHTGPDVSDAVRATSAPDPAAELTAELAHEQAHVDRVYAELTKAGARAALIEVEGLSRGRTDRVGVAREEEITGLFERDALVFNAGRRRQSLEHQYEGLVFGRLDLDDADVRYIGRLGVRDDDYEPLVIDWRAPAAAPFYRATPVSPEGSCVAGCCAAATPRSSVSRTT
ncbi:hypothetical protein [Branchiibius cervicis]|uniref:DNA helicase n=1 Tax=Branchiibius cervicis TaxID=908252 RepID=A0ABW2AW54_9MICO